MWGREVGSPRAPCCRAAEGILVARKQMVAALKWGPLSGKTGYEGRGCSGTPTAHNLIKRQSSSDPSQTTQTNVESKYMAVSIDAPKTSTSLRYLCMPAPFWKHSDTTFNY